MRFSSSQKSKILCLLVFFSSQCTVYVIIIVSKSERSQQTNKQTSKQVIDKTFKRLLKNMLDDENEIIFFDVGWLDTVVVVGLTCFILCECTMNNNTVPIQNKKETRD